MGQKPCGPFGESRFWAISASLDRLQCFSIARSSFLELASNSALQRDTAF